MTDRSVPAAVRRAGAVLVLVLAALALGATPASADDEEYVKFVTVTPASVRESEPLARIARRYLGDPARSGEIYNLNSGRDQPAGGTLTDPGRLSAGWMLMLPWDAVGAGIQYGTLAGGSAQAPITPDAPPDRDRPAPPAGPAPPGGAARPGGTTGCAGLPTAGDPGQNWAGLRLAADRAWSQSRGKGQLVAVVDSGVDATAPQLAGHVTVGLDLVTGTGRGDDDCLGTGTAMAGLIAGQKSGANTAAGVAPDASVLPVRIVAPNAVGTTGPGSGGTDKSGSTGTTKGGSGSATKGGSTGTTKGGSGDATKGGSGSATKGGSTGADKPGPGGAVKTATPERVAAAIDEAVAAGATILALGEHVDTGNARIAAAINAAVKNDTVVVAGAAPATAPAGPPARLADAVLDVAGVGVDGRPATGYRAGGVDVVAPGVNLRGVAAGREGTVTISGTRYGVAYVAGTAALVRGAYPELTAAQVAHRLQVTAERMGAAQPPDAGYGWGMVDPAEAVSRVLPEEATSGRAGGRGKQLLSAGHNGDRTLLIVVTAVALGAAVLLTFRIRSLLRETGPSDPAPDESTEDSASPVPAGVARTDT